MKKLLALLLCVMLFVSVIPGAAFADVPPELAASMGELYDKVYGYNLKDDGWLAQKTDASLMLAYSMLGGVYGAKILADSGIALSKALSLPTLIETLNKDGNYAALVEGLNMISPYFGEKFENLSDTGIYYAMQNPLDYFGIFKGGNPEAPGLLQVGYMAYDLFGAGVIANTAIKESAAADETVKAYNKTADEVMANSLNAINQILP